MSVKWGAVKRRPAIPRFSALNYDQAGIGKRPVLSDTLLDDKAARARRKTLGIGAYIAGRTLVIHQAGIGQTTKVSGLEVDPLA